MPQATPAAPTADLLEPVRHARQVADLWARNHGAQEAAQVRGYLDTFLQDDRLQALRRRAERADEWRDKYLSEHTARLRAERVTLSRAADIRRSA